MSNGKDQAPPRTPDSGPRTPDPGPRPPVSTPRIPDPGPRTPPLPPWAKEMREIFRSGTTSQFVLHGNVFDFVPARRRRGRARASSRCTRFLTDVLFAPVRRRRAVRPRQGHPRAKRGDAFHRFLKTFDRSPAHRGPGCPTPARTRSSRSTSATSCHASPSARSSCSTASCRGALARTRVDTRRDGPRPAQVAVVIELRAVRRPAGRGHPARLADLGETADPPARLGLRPGDPRRLHRHRADHREPRATSTSCWSSRPYMRQDPRSTLPDRGRGASSTSTALGRELPDFAAARRRCRRDALAEQAGRPLARQPAQPGDAARCRTASRSTSTTSPA